MAFPGGSEPKKGMRDYERPWCVAERKHCDKRRRHRKSEERKGIAPRTVHTGTHRAKLVEKGASEEPKCRKKRGGLLRFVRST